MKIRSADHNSRAGTCSVQLLDDIGTPLEDKSAIDCAFVRHFVGVGSRKFSQEQTARDLRRLRSMDSIVRRQSPRDLGSKIG